MAGKAMRTLTELAATATANQERRPPCDNSSCPRRDHTRCSPLTGAALRLRKQTKAPPGGDYQKVSDLVALPEFIPGLGTLYVQPATLPAGPFLAYDRDGQLVSTIYMIPLADIEAQKKFDDLAVGSRERRRRRHVLQRGPSGRRGAALSRGAVACARERCQAPVAGFRAVRRCGPAGSCSPVSRPLPSFARRGPGASSRFA